MAVAVAVAWLWAGSGDALAASTHQLMATTESGAPVRWACDARDVYVQDPPTPRHVTRLRRALQQLSAATGTTWRFAGVSAVDVEDADYQGDPIVVRFVPWSSYAGLTTLWREGDRWTGGLVELNKDVAYVGSPSRGADWVQLHALLLHELGHLAGLGHASDPALVMNDAVHGKAHRQYAPGDQAGLAAVGCG